MHPCTSIAFSPVSEYSLCRQDVNSDWPSVASDCDFVGQKRIKLARCSVKASVWTDVGSPGKDLVRCDSFKGSYSISLHTNMAVN